MLLHFDMNTLRFWFEYCWLFCWFIFFCFFFFFGLFLAAHSDTTVARMLVGNKCDLETIRAVSVEEGKALAEAEGLFFMETSALDSTNVKTAFEMVIRDIYTNVSRKQLNSDTYKTELSANNRVSLVKDDSKDSKQGFGFSCCSSSWPYFDSIIIFLSSFASFVGYSTKFLKIFSFVCFSPIYRKKAKIIDSYNL